MPRSHPHKIVCICLYDTDIKLLDHLQAECKRRKIRNVSRSGIIREALKQIDLDALAMPEDMKKP